MPKDWLRAAAALAGSLGVGTLVFAADAIANAVGDTAAAYVAAEGHTPADAGELTKKLAAMMSGGKAMAPAEVSLIEKALLVVESEEPPLPHTRYILRYSEQKVDDADLSFVDVQRYNLGGAVRHDAVSSYGAENVANTTDFGVGPHVAWRFVARQTNDDAAVLLAAGRKEIPEEIAAAIDCQTRTCLSLDGFDALATFTDEAVPERIAVTPPYADTVMSKQGTETVVEQTPAFEALQLALATGYAKSYRGSVLWKIPRPLEPNAASPLIVILLDRNLGQEIMSDMVIGLSKIDGRGIDRWMRLSGGIYEGKLNQSFATAPGAR